jgi:hypothetical protein
MLPDTAFLKIISWLVLKTTSDQKRDSILVHWKIKLSSTRFYWADSGNIGLMQRCRILLYLSSGFVCAASSLWALPETAFLKIISWLVLKTTSDQKRDSILVHWKIKLSSTRFYWADSGNIGLMQRYRILLYLSSRIVCAASSLGALPDTAFLKNNLVGIYDNSLWLNEILFFYSL